MEAAQLVSTPSAAPSTGLVAPRGFVTFLSKERGFLILLGFCFFITGATYQHAEIARWIGFGIAGYAAVANDSIQTLGTFISSNGKARWWVLWLFIGGIFLATIGTSWWLYAGDVSWQRLASKGFETAPSQFTYLQVAAPIFLLILTRLRMPVSTTFLLLSSFTTSASGMGSVLAKSVSGYVIAFATAFGFFIIASRWLQNRFTGEAHPAWRIGQWVTSGILWCIWLIQDAANIAVYLPRKLGIWEFMAFTLTIFLGLGLLFYQRGERIQEIVNEKSSVVDVRPATIIDLVYTVILFQFTVISTVPMSTTWVFIGLLGGRELAMALRRTGVREPSKALRMMGKDLGYATVGLIVSIAIATSVNPVFSAELSRWLGL